MKVNLINENNEYVQSANTLFHFMGRRTYLEQALKLKALVPRYCDEDISYLHIKVNDKEKNTISVLQKCFCDVPFHNLTNCFQIVVDEKEMNSLSDDEKEKTRNFNTHTDVYGEYAIAFSKKWGEERGLQPIHYLNVESEYVNTLRNFIQYAFELDNLSDQVFDRLIAELAFIKPLRGQMTRKFDSGKEIHFTKNFHDENEWRYVPSSERMESENISNIMVNPYLRKEKSRVNSQIQKDEYQDIWLKFDYEDIKYIIVPNISDRLELLNYINDLPEEVFNDRLPVQIQKSLLMSRILVLNEIRGDW